MTQIFSTPILLLIFNRPETTAKVWREIKKIKPSVLYVAADGPRKGNVKDQIDCQASRKIITDDIDWACDLHLLLRTENLGCGHAVSSAISWFFQNVEEGIILEDDCLPCPDFFPFCAELLQRYRHDDRVFMISGNDVPQTNKYYLNTDYCFTSIPSIWGWATWKRSWEKYDFNFSNLDEFKKEKKIEKIFSKISHQKYWLNFFQEVKDRQINTWDYQLVLTAFNNQGLCVNPKSNLIINLGMNLASGHKRYKNKHLSLNIKNHPKIIEANKYIDTLIMKRLFSPRYKIKTILKRIGLFYKLKKLYQRL